MTKKHHLMVKIGNHNGIDIYAFVDADGEKAVEGREEFAVDVLGPKGTRTAIQNNALHKYFEKLRQCPE